MSEERTGSEQSPKRGIPVWAWIIGALVLLAALAALVALLVRPGSSADPADRIAQACRSAIEQDVGVQGGTEPEVSGASEITTQGGGAWRMQGTVTFEQDGSTHTADVRCIVQDDGGELEVVSVRIHD
ncbi:hypothetical protein ACDF64_08885 [Agromyces sp. MMS24-JH15]|uniref:hypothetical protein n=1 Tax=Agromyces sp. MMS24-JH15 TaxID=3243765 RepID=UPI00374860DC